jgi:hypothetical protein
MICIFVGDTSDDLMQTATARDSSAQLITHLTNTSFTSGTYYTSLGDCNDISTFVEILNHADELIYVPPVRWTDTKENISFMKRWTEFYLVYFSGTKKVVWPNNTLPVNELNTMLGLADHRKTQQSQLWVAGCSISHGIGVQEHERYGQLLADELKLPVSFLTEPGSSIIWNADQILRSNIRSGDIVVWGLTSQNRLPFYYNKQLHHLQAGYYVKNPTFNQIVDINRLDDDDVIYRSISVIHQVINFCHSIDAELHIAGLLIAEKFAPYTVHLPQYLQLANRFGLDKSNMFLDVGTDNMHPGPKMHQWYAEQILKKIKNA